MTNTGENGPSQAVGRYTYLHARLAGGDSAIADAMAERLVADLLPRLRRQFVGTDPHIPDEAVLEVVLAYIKRPGQYDLERGYDLDDLLAFYARRRVLSRLRSERGRRQRECSLENTPPRIVTTHQTPTVHIFPIVRHLFRTIRNESDRRLFALRMRGERRSRELAKALGASDLSHQEQVKVVKQAKDRIGTLIRRWRKQWRH